VDTGKDDQHDEHGGATGPAAMLLVAVSITASAAASLSAAMPDGRESRFSWNWHTLNDPQSRTPP